MADFKASKPIFNPAQPDASQGTRQWRRFFLFRTIGRYESSSAEAPSGSIQTGNDREIAGYVTPGEAT